MVMLMKKIIFSIIILFSCLFLASCDYTPAWKNKDLTYYGTTTDYIISTDSNGNYHISEINRKAFSKNEFVVPKTVIINNEEIEIDYVDNIFSENYFLRKITIEFNKHELKLNNCPNLKIIEIDESNIINKETFLSKISGKYIYITNQTIDYSIYEFYQNNTVLYQKSPTSTFTKNFISNDLVTINIIIINLLIGILAGIFLLIYDKVYEPFHIFSKTSSIILFIMPILSIILLYISKNNPMWTLGIYLIIPFIIGVNAYIISDDSNLFKILLIILALASAILVYIFIYPSIISLSLKDVYLTTFIFALILAVIASICYEYSISTIISLILLPLLLIISFKLLDSMYYYGFKNIITSIILIGVLGIAYLGLLGALVLVVLSIVAIFVDYTISGYHPTYVAPAPCSNYNNNTSTNSYNNQTYIEPAPEISVSLVRDYAYKIPDGSHWENRPDITIRNGVIRIRGRINLYDSASKDDYNSKKNFCAKILKDRIKTALNKYYKEYPDGYSYEVKLEVEYFGNYYD